MRFLGIDPSTKTGFVALSGTGQIIKAKELTGIGDKDPKRMRTMIHDVAAHMQPNDHVGIEGFGFASQQAVQNGGIGWGIRMMLDAKGFNYLDIAPNTVKKYVHVTGWVGEKGNKQRISGPHKKKAVIKAIKTHYNLTFPSDNVADAFLIARITLDLWKAKNGYKQTLLPYQQEV
ncbi:hypothetical protein JCM19037_4147 [Geomicrobium sp. JCM 19037]|uniref:hypothetical protein n=1 Tax=Geomicrobium sp. JCM 19037 TaxID=1460634 RepID=UPI00045F22B5|nr:hypothetical protein [Geomicrobium sp. JCM 19037]GAK05634.1 hypothetical protein JCM19037_4147 [Geomicrobium sp. JCM 19037]